MNTALHRLGVVGALLLAGGALALAVGSETPRGEVSGRAVDDGSGRAIPGARLVLSAANDPEASRAEMSDAPTRVLRTIADASGNFKFLRVPAGDYHLSATTRAHASSGEGKFVNVLEGANASLGVKLKRSQPELSLSPKQRAWAPGEVVELPVRGYVDGLKTRDTLRVRVWKTRASVVMGNPKSADALRTLGDRWTDASGQSVALSNLLMFGPRLISSVTLPVKSADTEGFFHEDVRLPNTPGLYIAEVRHGKAVACAWASVGATGLVTKRAGNELLAFAADIQSGAPRSGLQVQVFRDGKKVASGPTNKDGVARLRVEKSAESSSMLIVASNKNGDESAVSRSDYSYEEGGDNSVALLTDRPIYRPGQSVFYKGIARQRAPHDDSHADALRYSVPKNAEVEVELRDPNGGRVLKTTQRASELGSFWGRAELSPEAVSGAYTLVASINGEEHTQDITVASYRKPEFSVSVKPLQKRYNKGDEVEALISADYYFGAPVAGGKVHYSVLRATDWAADYADESADADDEPDYESEGYEGEGYGEEIASGDVKLDAQGRAIIKVSAPRDSDENKSEGADAWQPQAENWTISASVQDAAEREQSGDGTAHVTQGAFRVLVSPLGALAQPKQAMPVTLQAIDYNGKPVANARLRLEAALPSPPKKNGDSNSHGDAVDASADGFDLPFSVRDVQTDAMGRATVQITPPRAGEARLLASAQDADGRELKSRAWVYAVSDDADADAWMWGTRSALTLVADKKSYRAGETARVLLASAHPGEVALLTLEGDKLRRAWTVPLNGHGTLLQVPVSASDGPNVHLCALTIRDKQISRATLPLRVTVPAREISVKITPDQASAQPGEQAGFSIQTLDARGVAVPAEVALGVVDESIYALREDDPKLLRNTFYPRRENAVSTDFSLDAEYLGEGDKADPVIQARRKFLDTAFWAPNVQTDARGQAHVSFPLPDNLTTWRATAWAQTQSSAFGRGTSKMLETKPFFARLETPRFWVEGDASRVLATLHNETDAEQSATAKLEASGLDANEATQSANIPAHSSATLSWPVAPQMAGLNTNGGAVLKLSAWTNDRKFTDAVEQTIPVRVHGREDLTSGSGRVTRAQRVSLTIPNDAALNQSRLTVRLAPTLAGSVVGALDYLTGFPYGCTEQTLSRFVPDLAVQDVLRSGNADPKKQAELGRMARDGVTRLLRFQHGSGGWGWWEHDSDDAWMTAYALYGLTLARDRGYDVPQDALDKAVSAATEMSAKLRRDPKAWRSERESVPFLLWAMSQASDKGGVAARAERARLPLAMMSNEELAYLALLDAGKSDATRAVRSVEPRVVSPAWTKLQSRMKTSDDGRTFWRGADRYEGDRLATALGLRAMLANDPTDARADSVILWLMKHRTGSAWNSTRDTAFVLLAVGDYLRAHPESASLSGTLRVRLNGHAVKTLQLSPAMLREPEVTVSVPWARLKRGANDLRVERDGESAAFYSYELRATRTAETLPPMSSGGINVKREYFRVLPRQNGDNWSLQTEPSNGTFAQGDQVRVRVTVWTPRLLEHVLIEDHFPSSLEVTERGESNENTSEDWNSWWSNTDVRDDRIAFFARRLEAGKHVIEYNLRAQTPGTGRALPTLVQEMYAPQVRAESGDASVQVNPK